MVTRERVSLMFVRIYICIYFIRDKRDFLGTWSLFWNDGRNFGWLDTNQWTVLSRWRDVSSLRSTVLFGIHNFHMVGNIEIICFRIQHTRMCDQCGIDITVTGGIFLIPLHCNFQSLFPRHVFDPT